MQLEMEIIYLKGNTLKSFIYHWYNSFNICRPHTLSNNINILVCFTVKLNDIKASFIFEKNVIKNENKQVIWKNGDITFTIYKHTQQLVNVTGLKSAEEIEQQKKLMEEMFQL